MDPRLREAARTGNIGVLYSLIQEDTYLLERIDEMPFVDTPLHIAAIEGHINFAMEMMNLKPSFARKLNQDGFSPMHLASKNGRTKLVLRLLHIEKDLVRVKGREGMTPFHFESITGNASLLVEFLEACPECIEDITVNGDTALHLALKSDQIEAFNLLVGWLQMNSHESAVCWESEIINWRDNEDNTVLHVAAKRNQHEALKRLLNSYLLPDIDVQNSEGLTALDIIKPENTGRHPIKGSSKKETKYLKPHLNFLERASIMFGRVKKNISVDMLNAMLVVMALVITATYQSTLSPPGGVFQAEGSSAADSSSNVTHLVDHSSFARDFFLIKFHHIKPKSPGTPVMNSYNFFKFWFLNSYTLWLTILLTVWLLSSVPFFSILVTTPLSFLAASYHYSMNILAPTTAWSIINSCMAVFMIVSPGLLAYPNFQKIRAKRDFLKVLQTRERHQRDSTI